MRKFYVLLAGFLLSLAAINAKPVTADVAYFTFTIDAPGNNVNFTNQTVLGTEPGLRKAFWNFGDGMGMVTGPLEGTLHHYQVAGSYIVCLKIYRYFTNTNDSVLTSQICKTIVIEPNCGVEFESLNTTPTSLSKYFLAHPAHNQNKKPVKICWNFGDGRDTCIQYLTSYTGNYSVNHLYNQPGSYNVCVNILYDGGCQAQKCHTLQLGPPPVSCAANFESVGTAAGITGNYFIAQPMHSQNKKPAKICWNFGDGRDTCINYPLTFTGTYGVFHHYNQPGNYNVCVNILYDGGCQASKCKLIQTIRPDSCKADFERIPANSGTSPFYTYFKALPGHNNNKKPSRICWNFGDGRDTCINYPETFTGQYVVNHRYLNPGPYQVCVNIQYFGGCAAQKCKPIQLGTPDSCAANFETPAATTVATGKYFIAQPWHNHNKKPVRICWTFGDGRDTCIQYPTNFTGTYGVFHNYNQHGAYNVCVNILYDGGCQATKCKLIVTNRPDSCKADFERIPTNTSATPLLAYFKAIPQHSNNKKPSRICWTFGDGRDTCINYSETFTGLYAVSHHYNAPGTYQVCVKINYFGGCVATKCKPMQVIIPAQCTANFESPNTTLTTLGKYFIALPWNSQGKKPVRICWIFGDGTNMCIQYQTNYTGAYGVYHLYNQARIYEVCATILYEGSCEARICKPVRVGINQPILVLSPNPVINNLTATFHSTRNEPVNIKILNGTGTPVRTFVKNAIMGINTWTFELSNLVPGIYSFIIQSPNQQASASFIKQ
ncbi:MAG: PKD domain-containing protein [Chitinophagaceae bacterium]